MKYDYAFILAQLVKHTQEVLYQEFFSIHANGN
jgi:hypothetical protein